MNQQQQLTTTIIENQPALPPPPPPQSPTTYSGILKKAYGQLVVIPAQHGIRIKDTVKLRDGKFLVNFKSPSSNENLKTS
ncbi:hypothetical protein DERF_009881 [Dermatophagoides farinae]|uniref:Uncharacterized protein n=1 Tax=Dermatophagoides farinae TaxID=6954 RepID=A0A922L4G1_DERFA|nr:hypothetical protein DERF_009881 [Dermatophagoides farinae]